MNCPNCLSPHTDEYTERDSSNVHRSLNHRKRGRLHNLTKAIFSPTRRSVRATQKSNQEFACCRKSARVNGNEYLTSSSSSSSQDTDIHWSNGAYSKYRLERKHKIKKRDLVKQYQRQSEVTGNSITINHHYPLSTSTSTSPPFFSFLILLNVYHHHCMTTSIIHCIHSNPFENWQNIFDKQKCHPAK